MIHPLYPQCHQLAVIYQQERIQAARSNSRLVVRLPSIQQSVRSWSRAARTAFATLLRAATDGVRIRLTA
jgi:hypothetical protein